MGNPFKKPKADTSQLDAEQRRLDAERAEAKAESEKLAQERTEEEKARRRGQRGRFSLIRNEGGESGVGGEGTLG